MQLVEHCLLEILQKSPLLNFHRVSAYLLFAHIHRKVPVLIWDKILWSDERGTKNICKNCPQMTGEKNASRTTLIVTDVLH